MIRRDDGKLGSLGSRDGGGRRREERGRRKDGDVRGEGCEMMFENDGLEPLPRPSLVHTQVVSREHLHRIEVVGECPFDLA